jgi:hypothetical protein
MDPFIEGQIWTGFHHLLIGVVVEMLAPQAVPRYSIRLEETVYLEHELGNGGVSIVPDAFVLEEAERLSPGGGGVATASAIAIQPVLLPVAMPEQRRHVYLTIRDSESDRIVTVLEILSPKNKRSGSDGRRRYLKKRERVLLSDAHLVEIDLLRGGARLPMAAPLPSGDYFAIVHREEQRPTAEVYAWTLRQSLPTIPVPLAGEDPDLLLDLQACCTTVYDRAAYGHMLKYRRPVEPPLPESDVEWVQQILAVKP